MATNLDRINFKKSDPKSAIDSLEGFPQLCRDAYKMFRDISLPSYYVKAKKFIIVGMGASGISGDIVSDLLSKNTDAIVSNVHDYSLPGWTDKDTVVILCSYSGDTEETVSAFFEATDKKAKLITITSGGKLEKLSQKYSVPLLKFDYKSCPRHAFPYLFISLLTIFSKLGYIDLSESAFLKSVDFLENFSERIKCSRRKDANPAKILAYKIYGKTVKIFGSGILKSAGSRFKTQINENSKNFASVEYFPELDHNVIEGINFPKNSNFVVSLESNFDNERIIKRQNITHNVFSKNKVSYERVKFVGCDNEILEVLTAVLFGDFVSYYLALLNNVDPVTTNRIDELKQELAR